MNIIEIPKTKSTPSVIFNLDSGILILTGKSYIEYPQDFYKRIGSYINQVKQDNIQITLNIDYTNTISNKCLLEALLSMFLMITSILCIYPSIRALNVSLVQVLSMPSKYLRT